MCMRKCRIWAIGAVALWVIMENGPLRRAAAPVTSLQVRNPLCTDSAAIGSREQVTSGSEMRSDDSVDVKEGLGCRPDLNRGFVSRQHSCAADA